MYRNEEEVGLYVEGRGNFETENAMQFRGRCLMMIMLIKHDDNADYDGVWMMVANNLTETVMVVIVVVMLKILVMM